jgi:PiT family inorganic phosphate transporter
MSLEITGLNETQGFAANLVTSLLVLTASKLGLPVSTTHVACGSLFGIGAATGGGRRNTIVTILGAWLVTLPAAAATAGLVHWVLSN